MNLIRCVNRKELAMNKQRASGWIARSVCTLLLLPAVPVSAQTFISGSTGADGPFAPTANTTLSLPPNGLFNFTTVTIPSGVTVTFAPNVANTPVTMLATGDVTIAGTIKVNGGDGAGPTNTGPIINPGGSAGVGGFAGGSGGPRGGGTGAPGQGPGAGVTSNVGGGGGAYGAPTTFVSLLPLFGGSGGAGGNGNSSNQSGAAGGGGGGAIVVASSTKIMLTGSITANGGFSAGFCGGTDGGGGSGGAIRLVAPQITGTGTLQAVNGFGSAESGCGGTPAGVGRIRVESFTLGFSGSSTPPFSFSTAPGPVTTASTPGLANVPTLAISSVGGIVAPANPGGSFAVADVSLPAGTTNPVPVTLTATNTPVGTVFSVKGSTQFNPSTTVNSSASTGTFANSTATASVAFSSGEVSLLLATASFIIPATVAELFPLIDGEPAEQVLMGATYGAPSSVMLRTKSGKEMRVDQLPTEEQVKFARAWEDFSKTH